MTITRLDVLVKVEEVIDAEHMPVPHLEQGIQPPEEGPIEHAAGGLGGIATVLLAEHASLLKGLDGKNESLDHDGNHGDDGDGLDILEEGVFCRTQPEGSRVGNIKEEGSKQERAEKGRGLDGAGVLNVGEETQGQGGNGREGNCC